MHIFVRCLGASAFRELGTVSIMRVMGIILGKPPSVETKFRYATSSQTVSSKVWADAWLLVVAKDVSLCLRPLRKITMYAQKRQFT